MPFQWRHGLSALLITAALCPVVMGSSLAQAAVASPRCVVSLSPTATETLFAMGAGAQVRAVDTDSNYPTAGLPRLRINALNPSVESVVSVCPGGVKPNLVIISYDANTIREKLTAVGVKVVTQDAPSSVAGALSQIRTLGALTGHVEAADTLAQGIASTIQHDIASVPQHPGKQLNTYYELDPTFYSLTSTTFVGALLKSLGVVNIADAKSTSADAGYPQLSAEYIVAANPKIIFLADTVCCKMDFHKVSSRAGWSRIRAVADHEVIGLNDDIASRWGPRLEVLMNELTAAVKAALLNQKLWN